MLKSGQKWLSLENETWCIFTKEEACARFPENRIMSSLPADFIAIEEKSLNNKYAKWN